MLVSTTKWICSGIRSLRLRDGKPDRVSSPIPAIRARPWPYEQTHAQRLSSQPNHTDTAACPAYAFAPPRRSPSLAFRIASSDNATVARSQWHSSPQGVQFRPPTAVIDSLRRHRCSTASRELPLLLLVWYRSVRPAAVSSRRNFESLAQRGAPAERNVSSAPEPKHVRQSRASFRSTWGRGSTRVAHRDWATRAPPVSAGQRAPSGQHPSLELTAMWLQKNDLQPLPS